MNILFYFDYLVVTVMKKALEMKLGERAVEEVKQEKVKDTKTEEKKTTTESSPETTKQTQPEANDGVYRALFISRVHMWKRVFSHL